MEISFDLMKSSPDSILMGDFNFGDGSENDEILSSYKDTWPSVHDLKSEPGYTFTYKEVRRFIEGVNGAEPNVAKLGNVGYKAIG